MHSLWALLACTGSHERYRRARSVPCALLAACVLSWFPSAVHAASWQQVARVAYVDTASPVATRDVVEALDYAIAAWSARIAVQLERAAAPDASGYREGMIVIRWYDAAELIQGGSDIRSAATTRRWLYRATGDIAGAEIFLRRDNSRLADKACLTHVLVHELGHALGLPHLASATSVMYPDLESCHHTLTADDIAAAPYPQFICHAELLPDLDIYIPVVSVGDKSWSARLAYDGGRWIVAGAWPTAHRAHCRDTHLEAGTLVLDRLWSPRRTWQAELEQTAEGWEVKQAR